MDDSAIICDEVMESYGGKTKAIPTNSKNEEKATLKTKNFYYLLAFTLHSIYCYLINHRAKQRDLLREVLY